MAWGCLYTRRINEPGDLTSIGLHAFCCLSTMLKHKLQVLYDQTYAVPAILTDSKVSPKSFKYVILIIIILDGFRAVGV